MESSKVPMHRKITMLLAKVPLEGMSPAEIADALNINAKIVYAPLHKMKQAGIVQCNGKYYKLTTVNKAKTPAPVYEAPTLSSIQGVGNSYETLYLDALAIIRYLEAKLAAK